jgi:tetratricopeptide (TPR) repeat protein
MIGQDGGEIPFGALALATPGEDDRARVLVRVRIDGPALLSGQTGETLRTEVALYALGTGGGVAASLLETVEADLASQRSAMERDGLDFLGSLGLRPGTYSLRILVRNPATNRLGVRTLPLTVAPLGELTPASATQTGDARPTARSGGLGPVDPPPFPSDPTPTANPVEAAENAPPLPVVPDTAEGRRLREAVRSAYRDALSRLAAGREAEAVSALAAAEDSLFRSGRPGRAQELVEIETAAAREISGSVLLPILRFHQALYEDATRRRRLQGSTVAREVFARLLDAYREHADPGLARSAEAVFGVALIRTGVRSQGGQMLRRVLAEDPGDAIALAELAVDAERHGDRAQALEHLAALLRAHPDDREARLRQALGLARLGRTAEAEEKLRGLIRDETGGWRLRIAYQELVRMRMASDPADAERLAAEGLRRLPGDEKLTLLLAFLRQNTAGPFASRQVLAGLTPEKDGGGDARNRYNRPPAEALEEAIVRLDREAEALRPALAAALEKKP